jgi:hypothetical protein
LSWNASATSHAASSAPVLTCDGDPSCTLPSLSGTSYPVPLSPAGTPIATASAGTGLGQIELSGYLWAEAPADIFAGTGTGTIVLTVTAGP